MGNDVLELALVLGAGRTALSLLPPGWPGYHGGRELGATLAASLLLGITLLAGQASLVDAVASEPRPALLFAPWALILALRLASLPGAMRPRHEPRAQPGDRRSWAVLLLGALGLGVPFVLTTVPHMAEGPLAALESALGGTASRTTALLVPAAIALLVQAGLERARRAPLQRSLVFAAVAWLPTLPALLARGEGSLHAALGLVAVGAGAVAWVRRADRRARALACAGAGGTALLWGPGWLPASLAVAALVLVTPRPGRARTLGLGVAVLAAALAARLASGTLTAPDPAALGLVVAPLVLLLLGLGTLRAERVGVAA